MGIHLTQLIKQLTLDCSRVNDLIRDIAQKSTNKNYTNTIITFIFVAVSHTGC